MQAMEQFSCMTENRLLGPADILEVDRAGARARLRLAGSEDDIGVWAQIAITDSAVQLGEGDQALVIGNDPWNLYVIGLLNRKPGVPKLSLQDGAYAAAAGPQAAKTLQVFSARNELLFEYDEANHKARVHVACGDIEFIARTGNIAFSAGREVIISGQSAVKIETPRLQVLVQTLMEKAKNIFRTVEQLSQIKAGRIRTLVDETYFFKAKKAFIKSDEDYKINAEKIHLG
jgi:hypothetical protein